MKLHVIVAPRHDLDFIIEEEFTEIKSNISIYDLVSAFRSMNGKNIFYQKKKTMK